MENKADPDVQAPEANIASNELASFSKPKDLQPDAGTPSGPAAPTDSVLFTLSKSYTPSLKKIDEEYHIGLNMVCRQTTSIFSIPLPYRWLTVLPYLILSPIRF
jgi:hypothetical protein